MDSVRHAHSFKEPSSFRDASGFVFFKEGCVYRQINKSYQKNYEYLMHSGLYDALTSTKLLVMHQEVDIQGTKDNLVYKIIKPEQISFISYPYEWCFSQLKNAALTTLKIQKKALSFGMSLKDASAYNIQFVGSKAIFIDSLSFEIYKEGAPWAAYRQFCQHFLAPLALMRYKNITLNQLLKTNIDGVPIYLASLLLPLHTYFKFSLLMHIHLHAKSQKYYADKDINLKKRKISRLSLLALIDNLISATQKLTWQAKKTEWSDYYKDTNYSENAILHKKRIISDLLINIKSNIVWDFGANTGLFSRIASDKNIPTIAFDIDAVSVEKNYTASVIKQEENIIPLILDLTNPSPSIGFANNERMSLTERAPVDTILALALIHHLAISNNLPLINIAKFFHTICTKALIIEFIPKHDSQVKKLLTNREDIFPDYVQNIFEDKFSAFFNIQNSIKIKNSHRILYLMQPKK